MSFHVLSCHFMSYRVISHHMTWHMSCNIMLYNVIFPAMCHLWYVMLCHVIFHVISYYIMSQNIMLYHVPWIMSWHVMAYAMCHVTYHVIHHAMYHICVIYHADISVDKSCLPPKCLFIYALNITVTLIQMLVFHCVANIAVLHSWLSTQADKVAQRFVHVLAQRFYFTLIYIPFILKLFNYI